MTELSGYVPLDFISVAVLGALGLRRLVLMERFHRARVLILTALLWAPAVYLFMLCWSPLGYGCVPPAEESGAFTISGM